VKAVIRVVTTLAVLVGSQPTFSQSNEPLDIVPLADDLCFYPDGDHAVTWDNAERRGFTSILPEDVPGLRLPGVRHLRGFTRTVGGTEFRVLTGVNRWRQMGRRDARFHLCWVSATPAERTDIDRQLDQFLDVGHFSQDDAFVFPWIPNADGSRQAVTERAFKRRFFELSREQGMRTVMTNDTGDRVSITYMRPVESCEDWCY
jgi:hypothetical protein